MSDLVVIAIGGNSLATDNRSQSLSNQWLTLKGIAKFVVDLIAAGWNVVLTHGNGPQLGHSALRYQMAEEILYPSTLDICSAEVQGIMGYMIQQTVQNELIERGIQRDIVSIITQVLVDANDQAFFNPSKPIGLFYSEEQASQLNSMSNWTMIEDSGRGWRRVVPSPLPKDILEKKAIQMLTDAGFVVIACGGGGIPVISNEQNGLEGVEAAVDKDLTGAMLALNLGASLYLIITVVEKVAINYRRSDQFELDIMSTSEAILYLVQGQFAKGSMEPKIKAAVNYLEEGGNAVLITNPQSIGQAFEGLTGTWIFPDKYADRLLAEKQEMVKKLKGIK
jgi:carbamate kinase